MAGVHAGPRCDDFACHEAGMVGWATARGCIGPAWTCITCLVAGRVWARALCGTGIYRNTVSGVGRAADRARCRVEARAWHDDGRVDACVVRGCRRRTERGGWTAAVFRYFYRF